VPCNTLAILIRMPFNETDARLLQSILDASAAGRSSQDLSEDAQPLALRGLLYWDASQRLRLTDVWRGLLRSKLRK